MYSLIASIAGEENGVAQLLCFLMKYLSKHIKLLMKVWHFIGSALL